MSTDTIENRVRTVMSQVFNLPPEALGTEPSRHNLKEWDSLNHMNLMLALEDEFGVEFSDGEIAAIESLEPLSTALRMKLG